MRHAAPGAYQDGERGLAAVSDSAKVVGAFKRFVASGYKRSLFTRELYDALSHSFGFIAHYDRDGFYANRFETPKARRNTFETMASPEQYCASRPLEAALHRFVEKEKLLEIAVRESDAATETAERAELARLKVKYESGIVYDNFVVDEPGRRPGR